MSPRRRERRNPFRSSLAIEPMWRRWVLAGVAVGVYAAAFIPLYGNGGVGVSALALFPVVVVAWLFGAWGGLISGMLSIPVNAVLLTLVGEPGWQIVAAGGGVEGSALVLVVGSVIGLLRDLGLRLDRHLTEWRRAERSLRASEDRYRAVFERSRDPMYVTHPEGTLLEANDALLRLLKIPRGDIEDVDVVSLYEDPEERKNLAREIQRVGYVEDFPVRLRMADGEIRDCLITASARYDRDREVVGYQGSIRDVSASRTLHELAERRTAELREAVDELEAFTYSVSHDLRTYLVTIGGFSSILLGEHAEGLDERARGFLERIVVAAGRMDAFVQDLLNYSRVTRAEVQPARIELDEAVAAAVAALQMPIEERGAQVDVALDLPAVEADPVLLSRVLENLLSNAIKFVEEGTRPDVRIEADVEDVRVRIKVRDNGIGIDPADVERAFRAFERLEPGRFPGTGVGLTIVDKAVDRMGGDVGVRSTPGEGSTFWVTLPLALPAELVEE